MQRSGSAYQLTQAAEISALKAAVRAAPAKRATDEAARASLRAAGAAEAARYAASMAGAARAQANARMEQPERPPLSLPDDRARMRLLP